jgi:hypothetical protein
VKQVVICWIGDPAFYRDGIFLGMSDPQITEQDTFMPGITRRRVIQDANLAKVLFDDGKIFDVGTIFNSAMLSVIPSFKVFSFGFKPVNDGVRILLNGCREYHTIVPF